MGKSNDGSVFVAEKKEMVLRCSLQLASKMKP